MECPGEQNKRLCSSKLNIIGIGRFQGSKPMSEGDADGERVRSQQEAVKEGAPHPADMAGG